MRIKNTMADITSLPSNVKQDPNTGLYIITNSTGRTLRVGAQTQEELNSYVSSVNTGTPVQVQAIDPNTGNARTVFFDPNQIFGIQDAVRTRPAAPIPPAQFEAATAATNEAVNTPSNLPLAPNPESVQPPPGATQADTVIADPQSTFVGDLEVVQDQQTVDQEPQSTFVGDLEVVQDQPTIETGSDPSIQVFDDGSTLQTFDDGSTLATDSEGGLSSSNASGLTGAINNTRAQATAQDAYNAGLSSDWRVKLVLAPSANYLYKAADPGILAPLRTTNGVIFPYTPQIQVSYAAHYDATDLTHSNYKVFQYKNSSVDNVSITCDFTAQDTAEANYVLAVIHFFRSVTKMFYGQDAGPKPGTPPPLCYLIGLGSFQFNNHPLAITNFSYNLPNEVDYIRASPSPTASPGVNRSSSNDPDNSFNFSSNRAGAAGVPIGGNNPQPAFSGPGTNTGGTVEPTYVPTKIQIQITAVPIITRNDVSNNFSLRDYASGKLLKGKDRSGGGMW